MQDINNTDNTRTDKDAVLDFGTVDVTGFTGVTMSFDYEVDGFDSNDDMFYTATFDGIAQAEVQFVDGFSNLDASGTISISVPGGTGTVSLQVRVDQDNNDYGGWDNFKVTGTPPSTDPRVFFSTASATVAEGNMGTSTVNAVLQITNPGNQATVVTLTRSGASDNTDATVSTTSVTFPANSSDDQTVIITVNGDTDLEPDEDLVLTISNVTGGPDAAAGFPNSYTLTIQNDEVSPLVINEFLADPADPAGDANGDGTRDEDEDEFVEIVNTGSSAIDISGYTISDAGSVRHIFDAATSLPAGQSITVFGGGTPTNIPGLTATASSNLLSLNNTGDTITLSDDNGTEVTTVTYGGEGNDNQSLARSPNLTGAFVKHTTIVTNSVPFSPGQSNDDGGSLPVELTTFTATANGASANLRWTTASETNNTGFEVQMDNGAGFVPVEFVHGAGTTLEARRYALPVSPD